MKSPQVPTGFGAQVLVSILAAVDCLFTPERKPRDCDRRTAGWRMEAQLAYISHGTLRWNAAAAGASRSSDARQVQRIIIKFAADGLAVRTTLDFVGLTPRGDELARALCGLPALSYSYYLLRKLVAGGRREGYSFLGHKWFPEAALVVPKKGWTDGKNKGWLEGAMMPCLVRGLIVANTCPLGHCWYAATPAGIEWAGSHGFDEEPEELLGICDPDLRHFYLERIVAGHGAWIQKGDPREVGAVPMPASIPDEFRDIPKETLSLVDAEEPGDRPAPRAARRPAARRRPD